MSEGVYSGGGGAKSPPAPAMGLRVGEQGLHMPMPWGRGGVWWLTPGRWDGIQLNTLFLL